MSSAPLGPDILISHLSHRANHLLKAMINISDPPKPPHPELKTRDSSVGVLDRLPLEILFLVLDSLDVQSLGRFSTVSFQGSVLVRTHPEYRALVKLAPKALLALGKTGLLGLHPVAQLHRTLQCQKCATCPEYGAFLFLPTCERHCWQCLRSHPSLRMLLARDAAQYFDLTERQLRSMPSLRVIPGTYDTCGFPSMDGSRLFSVKALKTRALEVHGSEQQLRQALTRRCKRPRAIAIGSYYHHDKADQVPQEDRDQDTVPQDDYFGMAFLPFPSISKKGEIENGLWCKGCELIFRKRHLRSLIPNAPAAAMVPAEVLEALVPPGQVIGKALLALDRRALSKEDFLSHIKQCWGAWQLAPQLAPPPKDSADEGSPK